MIKKEKYFYFSFFNKNSFVLKLMYNKIKIKYFLKKQISLIKEMI